MKKMLIGVIFILYGLSLFAQTPKYARTQTPDGTWFYAFETESDALQLLRSDHKFPSPVWIGVFLKGIYIEESYGIKFLKGTKLLSGGETNGPLGGIIHHYYNLDRNTVYFVVWARQLNEQLTEMNKLLGINRPFYFDEIWEISDRNGNPLVPVRR